MEPPALLALALGTLGVIAALPTPPTPSLLLPRAVELGTPFNVTCVTNVTADNVTITADGKSVAASPSGDGHGATATVTVTHADRVLMGCTVRVGGQDISRTRTVYVYHVPEPLLTVSTSRPAAGTELSGTCSLPPNATRDIQVRVLLVAGGDKVLAGWGQPPLAFALPVGEEEEEGELQLLCQAELESFGRNSSVPITVLVKPQLNTSSCPTQQNWTEGREETLRCRAWGRPPPQIRCSRDGAALEVGSARRAQRGHAGTYRCRASNELGAVERNVTVWVHYDDSVPVLPLVLGTLLPALTLLTLAGFYLLYRHNSRIGIYWLWKH